MGDTELLEMLASETERRAPAVIEGVRDLAASGAHDPDRIEEIRVEIHGLKGAALVVGQPRLAELAREIEVALVQRIGPGTIPADLAVHVADATAALNEGAAAAARGEPEPASVGAGLAAFAES